MSAAPKWIDIHAHFDMLEGSPAEVLQKCSEVGVEKVITIGTEPNDHAFVLKTAQEFYPRVFCTIGVHPHQALLWDDKVQTSILPYLSEKEVVAVGEIGLDYYYNQSPKEKQHEAFRAQLEIAATHKLPVQIHTRDADDDTNSILSEFRGRVRGVIHCFTSSQQLARQCLDLGYNISFSGIVTFKNAETLRETCRFVPLDRMHVETDSPFLAPVPMRGKKNIPAYVVHTAEFVAKLKGISLMELSEATNSNARQIFPKIVW